MIVIIAVLITIINITLTIILYIIIIIGVQNINIANSRFNVFLSLPGLKSGIHTSFKSPPRLCKKKKNKNKLRPSNTFSP